LGAFKVHHLMPKLMLHPPGPSEQVMRTTINIDEALLEKASKLAGSLDRSAVLHEGLKALIERESAKRLARLGGTEPSLKAAPRRRARVAT
jgi:Arc/MetJ family transcription regulator